MGSHNAKLEDDKPAVPEDKNPAASFTDSIPVIDDEDGPYRPLILNGAAVVYDNKTMLGFLPYIKTMKVICILFLG